MAWLAPTYLECRCSEPRPLGPQRRATDHAAHFKTRTQVAEQRVTHLQAGTALQDSPSKKMRRGLQVFKVCRSRTSAQILPGLPICNPSPPPPPQGLPQGPPPHLRAAASEEQQKGTKSHVCRKMPRLVYLQQDQQASVKAPARRPRPQFLEFKPQLPMP